MSIFRSWFQTKVSGNWSNSENSQTCQKSRFSKNFWKLGSVQISVQNLRPHAATRKMGSTFRKTKNIFIEWDWRSFLEKHTANWKTGLWELNIFVHFWESLKVKIRRDFLGSVKSWSKIWSKLVKSCTNLISIEGQFGQFCLSCLF